MSQRILPNALTTHTAEENLLIAVKDLSFALLVSKIQQQIDLPLVPAVYHQKQLLYAVTNVQVHEQV